MEMLAIQCRWLSATNYKKSKSSLIICSEYMFVCRTVCASNDEHFFPLHPTKVSHISFLSFYNVFDKNLCIIFCPVWHFFSVHNVCTSIAYNIHLLHRKICLSGMGAKRYDLNGNRAKWKKQRINEQSHRNWRSRGTLQYLTKNQRH